MIRRLTASRRDLALRPARLMRMGTAQLETFDIAPAVFRDLEPARARLLGT